jgi:hypothetical protein
VTISHELLYSKGTSGDTGSAAIEAVRGLKWVDIVVLLPRGRTSFVQEKQMTTAIADNVHVYRGIVHMYQYNTQLLPSYGAGFPWRNK